ncbi:hypothetical protein [Aquimarina macrocephali]|uniref:hypothetical protein n=1 Tax=Aquimarina macrocephali TaxID=666563 RepID=UPI000465C52E|nr:hypothetical protein [Aquimarina macrocephali]
MKEINFHNSDLVSISKFHLDVWSDKIAFKKLVSLFAEETKHLFGSGQRPYEENLINIASFQKQSHLIYHENKFHDLIFSITKSSNFFSTEAELVVELWSKYEHSLVLFTDESELLTIINKNDILYKKKKKLEEIYLRLSWKELTSNVKSFVFFKGTEDDVIWIGKNSLLEFPDFNEFKKSAPQLR